MLNSWSVALAVATALGFLAGLGVGGGSLLVLWLTLVLGMPHPQARIYNLLFFIPSAVIASLFRWHSGNLNLKKVLPGVLTGCLGAAAASLLGQSMDISLLKKLFGVLLLATGLRELCYKPKNK
ncbi:MAG: sulfite exporter TauE/SafE family protein [Oscillospiraceae bacterium]|nr:sulfite exporter TauE/SafE family protein [Oscillospiraceae bacterium]